MKVESRSLILEASCLDRRFQYYNQRRRHCGYQTPAQFLAANIET